MAAPKRKAENAATIPKKETGSQADRSAKRQRKSEVATDAPKTGKSSIAKLQNAPQKSVFTSEEKSFPRGGASALTPLEHKQIQIKATQDVLFEQAGVKRSGDDGLSDAMSDVDAEHAPKAGKKRKSKKTKKGNVEEEEAAIRVEGLSYKVRLANSALGLVLKACRE